MDEPGGGDSVKPSPDCRCVTEIDLSHHGQSVKRAVRFDQGQVRGADALGALE